MASILKRYFWRLPIRRFGREWGRSKAMMPPIDGSHQLHYIRAEAEQGEHFLTVLIPRKSGEDSLTIQQLALPGEQISAYKLTQAAHHWVILLVNGGALLRKL